MPERQNSPGGDGPEYDWLYGGSSGAGGGAREAGRDPRGSSDPEPTRMLPRLDRPDGAGARRDVQPAQPVPPARSSGSGSGGGSRGPGGGYDDRPLPARRPRRARRVRRLVYLVLVAWLAFLVAVPVWALGNMSKVDIEPRGDRPPEQPGTTYLVVGSDSRRGLSDAEAKRLGTGNADIGQRTDTIMLLHTGDGPNLLLSIPRDSLVEVPGRGTTKINAAFAIGGPRLLVRTIEQNTGVRIDDYVEIGFGGFVNTVDAVGGITICPRQRMVDKQANLRIRKGCQEVDGVTALGYARSRKVSQYGDLDRARHQREVVSAIGAEVKSPWTFLNPVRYFRVNQAASTSLRISEGTGPLALAGFGLGMTRVDGESGKTCSMPIRDQAVHWDRDRALALMKLIKEDRIGDVDDRLCTPTGLVGVQ